MDEPTDETELRQEQDIEAVDELLFSGPQQLGVGKGLFLGRFFAEWVMPYPRIDEVQERALDLLLAELLPFLDAHLDPAAIDRTAEIPRAVIEGLGRLGVLGMSAPFEVGGRALPQVACCRVMEEIGSRCGSTSAFVNAHQATGIRALLLHGTQEQKVRWLPRLVKGEQLAAFALTEREAGSDVANVQTRAVPGADGAGFVLDGAKRYITNGGIAQVLTVFARTPVEGEEDGAVTAFVVTPDMAGFQVAEARMEKLGLRGTAVASLEFHGMPVPAANVLGEEGKGLKVALASLDFGRLALSASCTGAARTCLRLAVKHADTRRQFGRALGEFELVKAKLARMTANAYAMEAMTTVTAGLIDRGAREYMIETAMLKVFTTEALWEIVNDAFQIHGGSACFTGMPLERMLRDARIHMIADGANEVLTSFIALIGARWPGTQLKEIWEAIHHPWEHLRTAWQGGMDRAGSVLFAPDVPVRTPGLQPHAVRLGRTIWRFNLAVDRTLIQFSEDIIDRQYTQERLARAAMELYASACVLSRWDAELASAPPAPDAIPNPAPEMFLKSSFRRIRRSLAELRDNDDAATSATAEWSLRQGDAAP